MYWAKFGRRKQKNIFFFFVSLWVGVCLVGGLLFGWQGVGTERKREREKREQSNFLNIYIFFLFRVQ